MRFRKASLLADGVVFDVICGASVGFCFIKFNKNDFLSLTGAFFGELLFAIKSDFTNTLFSSAGCSVDNVVVVVATVDIVTRVVLGFRRFRNASRAAFTVLGVGLVVVLAFVFRILCTKAILAGFTLELVVVEIVVAITFLLELVFIRFKNASLAGFTVVLVAIVVVVEVVVRVDVVVALLTPFILCKKSILSRLLVVVVVTCVALGRVSSVY